MFCWDNVTWEKIRPRGYCNAFKYLEKESLQSRQRIKYTTRKLYYIFTWESCTSKELVFEI